MVIPSVQNFVEERLDLKGLILPLLGNLHRVALRLTHSNRDAEDLVAETVMRACENINSLRDTTKAKQWMLRILFNIFFNMCRTEKLHKEVPLIETPERDEETFSLFDAVSQLSSDEGNPERELVNKLLDEEIQHAIASLPEDYRVVVVLCDVEGYAYEEIAKMLEIPMGTVRSRLARGRSLLQKRLYTHAQERGLIARKRNFTKNKETNERCTCEQD